MSHDLNSQCKDGCLRHPAPHTRDTLGRWTFQYKEGYSAFFHFPPVSFLAILQILGCAFLLFQVFQCFSPYSSSYSVHFSFYTFFQCFSPHSSSYSVCFSFCTFFSFLTTFQVLPCEFLIFLVCQVSRYIPGPTVCVSHFPRFRFSCPIPGSIMCVIHFPHFSVFWPYSRSYSVCISFCTP